MADFIIILILLVLGGLTLRSCLRKKKGGDRCSGGCGNCHGLCHQQNKRPRP
jgi:hypothetical protein